LSDDEIKQNFIDGKYAFYVFDSFRLAEFCDDSVNPGFSRKITFTAFPAINSGKAIESSIVGTSCETFAVYTNSKNKEQAARYAGILTRLICHYAYQYGYGIPAWTPYGDTSSVPSNVQDVTELCRTLYSFSADSKYNMSEYDYQTYLEYVDQIYSGEMNGEAFISGMSKDIR
jgi:raffinose/stachyose/melibiose transport system substrate-binding protein